MSDDERALALATQIAADCLTDLTSDSDVCEEWDIDDRSWVSETIRQTALVHIEKAFLAYGRDERRRALLNAAEEIKEAFTRAEYNPTVEQIVKATVIFLQEQAEEEAR